MLVIGFIRMCRYEATELRDGDKGKYLGKGVSKAVKNVNEKISEALIGMDPSLQSQIDQAMMDLDKTENKASFAHSQGFLLVYQSVHEVSGYMLHLCASKRGTRMSKWFAVLDSRFQFIELIERIKTG